MRYLFWIAAILSVSVGVDARTLDLKPLADCSVKVFKDINRNNSWSGKVPAGCDANVHVERRVSGIFVTTWFGTSSLNGWERLALSSAMSFAEVASKQRLEKAGRDITTRAARIGLCLDSIIRVNDPLECRDYATKTYSAGESLGVEYNRSIWLEDAGRHSVVEHAYGDTEKVIAEPADLFVGPALPPGLDLKLHIRDSD
jgi:hypothetical protein